ncbi:hypothetical protein CVT26_004856 [Gymnopilus dilepis]|uniref:Uncharacterized protein n=1 Tax=Gymnopilus dilepis TaxID=231916 RepID=A0A409YTU3_9AGAR|nr:hypothetical protein CVT26_004856 [Gymnopilus dilepis]
MEVTVITIMHAFKKPLPVAVGIDVGVDETEGDLESAADFLSPFSVEYRDVSCLVSGSIPAEPPSTSPTRLIAEKQVEENTAEERSQRG